MVLVVACTILFLLVDRTIGQDTFTCARGLRVVTWNVAAINNNPFEYWITHPSPGYNQLMQDVQAFLDAPGSGDVAVSTVLTDAMVDELAAQQRHHLRRRAPVVARRTDELHLRSRVLSGVGEQP